jgi:ADP-ribose pyrophosphatase YjhB (NUDIX family)
MKDRWLSWIQQLQAIAQNGLRYSKDKYDIDRFKQLRSITVDMLASLSGSSPEPIIDLFSSYEGTATPKIDVRAVIIQDEKVLLVREIGEGKWTLPGGWADVGTSLGEAVVKEAKEESGYLVKPVRILAVQDRPRHNIPPIPEHTWKIFVEASILEEGKPDNLETDGVGFFSLDDLPPLSTGRVTRSQIERMFELIADPSTPADFD